MLGRREGGGSLRQGDPCQMQGNPANDVTYASYTFPKYEAAYCIHVHIYVNEAAGSTYMMESILIYSYLLVF